MSTIPRDLSASARLRRFRMDVGVVALAALLGAGAVDMAHRSRLLLAGAGHWAKLSPTEARRRTFGAAYTDAVDGIRRDLPEEEWYLLVPPPQFEETGWAVWLRYDLAPRRPVLIEGRGRRGLRTANGAAAPKWVSWVVLPGDGGVPVLVTREEALARLKAHGGR